MDSQQFTKNYTSNLEKDEDLGIPIDIKPGDPVKMKDVEGNVSYGLLLMIRGNPLDPSDPGRDAVVLLDDHSTKDPLGPADPNTPYWVNSRPTFEKLAGRKLTSEDRLASPDFKETLTKEAQDTVFIWVEGKG